MFKRGLLSAPGLSNSAALRWIYRRRETITSALGRRAHTDFQAPDGFPIPPPRLRVAVSGIADPANHIEAGEESSDAIEMFLGRNGVEVAGVRSLLDFGCGSGRVTRRWAGLAGTEVHGCDYNTDAIAWCRRNLPFAGWEVNGLEPPLPYEDGRFQLVYALSVFTHFREELQGEWMAEMRRVIGGDGRLVFTTMGTSFRSHLTDEEQGAFDDGELIVHFPNSAGMNMCAAYHPRAFVERLVEGAGLTLLDSLPVDDEKSPYPQDMWLAGPQR